MAKPIDITNLIDSHSLALQIAQHWQDWDDQYSIWLDEKAEVVKYLTATKTDATEVGALPWKNNTTLPKLTQIADNLHANYMSALFPNSKWLDWTGSNAGDEVAMKREAALAYTRSLLEQNKFKTTTSELLRDWIWFGNCFAMPIYEAHKIKGEDGVVSNGFHGSKALRISPYDIRFNIIAADFEATPKIIRSVKTLGELKRDILLKPDMKYLEEVFNTAMGNRQKVGAINLSKSDTIKQNQLQIDGFGDMKSYYESGYVEILDFYGDIYEKETGTLHMNQMISVVDRNLVIRKIDNPSWLGRPPIYHCGWRPRPDNLMAMSPLDNIVGLQYTIDKLHNSISDVVDQNIHPMTKIIGMVDAFTHQPGGKITIPEANGGDVQYLRPDMTALSVYQQIPMLEQKMEEFAGAPRQAMGFRTPGEKTKFEVQVLEGGSSRIFLNKAAYFEEVFLERLINDMFATDRRLMPDTVLLRMESPYFNAAIFKEIKKEDISSTGWLRPIGARHIAEKANQLQELIQLNNASQDPAIRPHVSGKAVAKLMWELAGYDTTGIIKDNVLILEQLETAQMQASAKQTFAEQEAVGVPEGTTEQVIINE
jgi:hypothetical protein